MKAGIRLGDICDILNGFAFKSEKYVCEGVRIIRIANVQKGYLEDSAPQYYPLETASELKKYMLEEGDILMSLTGNVGRVAQLSANMLPAALNQRVACLRLKDSAGISKDFLFQFLNSDYFESHCILSSKGIAQKNVSTEWLKEYEIPLFTPKEQMVIASQLSKIDILIAVRYQMLVKLDELVKSRFVELFYEKGFSVLSWNEVFNTTTGKLDSNAAVVGGEYPFFTCSKEPLRIDKYAFEQEALLLAGNNAAGKYDVKYYNGRFNAYQRTYVLGLKENWSYRLFQYQLEDKLEYLQQQSLGGLTKYLTLKILGELSFIIPPKELQNEFEVFVAEVDKSKLAVKQSLEKLETLKKSLMQQYFG